MAPSPPLLPDFPSSNLSLCNNLFSVDLLSPVWSSCHSIWACQYASEPLPCWGRQQQFVGALKSRKRREVKSKQKETWLTTYKAVGWIRSLAKQTNGGREPHDKRSRYGPGAWMRDREGGRKSLSAMWGGREGTSMRVVHDEGAITLQYKDRGKESGGGKKARSSTERARI